MKTRASLIPLMSLLLATLMLIPLKRNVLLLPAEARVVTGLMALVIFALTLWRENPERKQRYLALALPLGILMLAPINTDLRWQHVAILATCFVSVLVIPPLILRRPEIITFKFWPEKLDWLDVFYTLISIPLAWGAFKLYFNLLSPEVPLNWVLPAEQDGLETFKLFMGINAVGIWDELFFVNICYAVLRSLFPYCIANPAQAVIYMAVLYDMAFSGWGPLFVYALALTQGAMYERSRALLWVLLVHLIVDFFLFQAIIERYYPGLDVWWH